VRIWRLLRNRLLPACARAHLARTLAVAREKSVLCSRCLGSIEGSTGFEITFRREAAARGQDHKSRAGLATQCVMRASFKLVTLSVVLSLGAWACGSDDDEAVEGGSGRGGSAGSSSNGGKSGNTSTAGRGTMAGEATTLGGVGGESPLGGAGVPAGGDTGAAGDTSSMAGEPATGGAAGAAGAGGGASAGGAGGDGSVASCKGTPPACAAQSELGCSTVAGCAPLATKCSGAPDACETYLSTPTCAQAQGCSNGASCTGTPTACADRLTAIACDDGCAWVPCGGPPTACRTVHEATCALHSGCTWE
jgi:hypothetical protein